MSVKDAKLVSSDFQGFLAKCRHQTFKTGEHSYIGVINKHMMRSKRLWVAFEAVKRDKPKNRTLNTFMAISPVSSKWRSTVGSSSYFEIKQIEPFKGLDIPAGKLPNVII